MSQGDRVKLSRDGITVTAGPAEVTELVKQGWTPIPVGKPAPAKTGK